MAQEATLNVNIVDNGTAGPMPPAGGWAPVAGWRPPTGAPGAAAPPPGNAPPPNAIKDFGRPDDEGKKPGSKKTGIATVDYAIQGSVVGGPAGAAIGAAVGALKDLAEVAKYTSSTLNEIARFDSRTVFSKLLGPVGDLSDAVSGTARRLGRYSAELSVQQAQFEVRRMLRDIDRAQNFGPDLASHEEARFQLEQRIADLMDKSFPIIVNLLTNMLEGINQSVGFADNILQAIENALRAASFALDNNVWATPLIAAARSIHDLRDMLRQLLAVAEANNDPAGLFVDQLFALHVPQDVRRIEEGMQNILQSMRRNFVRGAMPAAPVFPNLNL